MCLFTLKLCFPTQKGRIHYFSCTFFISVILNYCSILFIKPFLIWQQNQVFSNTVLFCIRIKTVEVSVVLTFSFICVHCAEVNIIVWKVKAPSAVRRWAGLLKNINHSLNLTPTSDIPSIKLTNNFIGVAKT